MHKMYIGLRRGNKKLWSSYDLNLNGHSHWWEYVKCPKSSMPRNILDIINSHPAFISFMILNKIRWHKAYVRASILELKKYIVHIRKNPSLPAAMFVKFDINHYYVRKFECIKRRMYYNFSCVKQLTYMIFKNFNYYQIKIALIKLSFQVMPFLVLPSLDRGWALPKYSASETLLRRGIVCSSTRV